MTTSVQILMPKNNHLRAKVQSRNPKTKEIYSEEILDHGTVSEEMYVHDDSELLITEVE